MEQLLRYKAETEMTHSTYHTPLSSPMWSVKRSTEVGKWVMQIELYAK